MIALKTRLIDETPNSTLSELTDHNGKFICFIIEDGHRDAKEYGKTRIPAGVYKISRRTVGRFAANYAKKFRQLWIPHIVGVPNFKYILIHIGNTTKDTKGCLLPNTGVSKDILGNYVGNHSTKAYLRLYSVLKLAFKIYGSVEIEINRTKNNKNA